MMVLLPAVISMLFVLQVSAATVAPVPPLPPEVPPFDVWLAELRVEAASRGISPELIERALTDVQPVTQIIERDRSQAEFTFDLDAYLKRRFTRTTLRTAQRMYTRHQTLAARVAARYAVSPKMLIAVWGIESNFGQFSGVRPTVPALVTLAYDPRRAEMFRRELFSALEIVERGFAPLEQLKGSWAGAIGQPQFMPSSYLKYAQDFDGDGDRDIWKSQGDVFASIAYYLEQHGWKKGETWGREVTLTPAARKAIAAVPLRSEGCRAERRMTEAHPLSFWRKLGVRTKDKRPLPAGTRTASLVDAGTRSFLVYGNYEALLGYNCSHNYALSVALLAERLR